MIRLPMLLVSASLAHAQVENVILIMADDLNERINPYGDYTVPTPNLNRLAARAVTFRRSICQFPYCQPSRSSIMSGLNPWTTRTNWGLPDATFLFPTRPNMPQTFAGKGYALHSVGKTRHRWATRESAYATISRAQDSTSDSDILYSKTFPNGFLKLNVFDSPRGDFEDFKNAEAAVAVLREWSVGGRRQGMFMMCGFESPHDPYSFPREYWESTESLPDLITPEPETSEVSWNLGGHRSDYPFDDSDLRELRRAYYSEILMLDDALGILLDEIDRQDLWKTTIVVFASDHGFSLGEHTYHYSKANPTKSSINSPLIIAHPGGGAGVECWGNVQLVDIFPTLLDATDTRHDHPIPNDGRSLMPLVRDPSGAWPYPSFAVCGGNTSFPTAFYSRVVQLDRWKYLEHGPDPERASRRLFNMDEDSGQHVNLLRFEDNTYHRKVANFLASILREEIQNQRTVYGWTIPGHGFFPDRDLDGVHDEVDQALGFLGMADGQDDSLLWQIVSSNTNTICEEALGFDLHGHSGPVAVMEFSVPDALQRLQHMHGRIGSADFDPGRDAVLTVMEGTEVRSVLPSRADRDSDGMSDELESKLAAAGFDPSLGQEELVRRLFACARIIYWSQIPFVRAGDLPRWKALGPGESVDGRRFFETPHYGYPLGSDKIIFTDVLDGGLPVQFFRAGQFE